MSAREESEKSGPGAFTRGLQLFSLAMGWVTPRRQLRHLLENRNNAIDSRSWESFRDGLIRRWTNLNIVCGLIMGAISTILFGNFALGHIAFAFGVVTLLSSLICIGFGVGLMYVLGDVQGPTLRAIGLHYPNLYLFALSIPQIWGAISFGAFFVHISLIGFQATDKGVIVKIGISGMLFLLFVHLIAFAFLFRSQDDPAYLIPEPEFDEPPKSSGIVSPGYGVTQGPRRRPTVMTLQSHNEIEEDAIREVPPHQHTKSYSTLVS